MTRFAPLFLLLALPACTAARSTAHLVRMEQEYLDAATTTAPQDAVYEWTLAEAWREKAREEWARSELGEAERCADLAAEWARKAREKAGQAARVRMAEEMPADVPERAAPRREEQPAILPSPDERIDVDRLGGDDEDEEEEAP